MEFLLLGPLEVRLDGRPLPLGPRRAERCLLGLLLLEAGKVVSIDRLCDLLWDSTPPDNASAILQTHVSRLRSRLDPKRDGGNGFQLLAHGAGYQADASRDTVDAFRFRSLLTEAEKIADHRAKANALREALSLWRGPLLADVASDRLRDRIGTGLDELRLNAWETCMEAELAAGRHREITPELNDLVAGNPLRERLVHTLMLALYHDGRQACALDTFRDARQAMIERTGLDVSPRLAALHGAILRDEITVSEPPEPSRRIPRQLPPDVSHFLGRSDQLTDITQLAHNQRGRFLTIAAIHGPGGSGKSALAIRVANLLSDGYPDGQLYLDLQGATPGLAPLPPHEGLERWLRTLGMDSRVIPHSEAEASAAFRDLISDRRMILLLDNARDAAQVKPLLPSNPECFVLVTSRTVLPTLDNAAHIKLGLLTEPESIALMRRFDTRAVDNQVASGIVKRCGYLPLAIRIAGARLAAHPDWTLNDLKGLLDREHARLDVLQVDDLSVRASIKVSYDSFNTDPSHHPLATIGRLDFVDLTTPVLHSLFYGGPDPSDQTITKLVEHQLIRPTAPGRYNMHDLIRDYSREQGRLHDDQDPVYRVLDYYYAAAAMAHRLCYVGSADAVHHVPAHPVQIDLTDAESAIGWINAELPNLMSSVRQATGLGGPVAQLAVKLVRSLTYPLYDMVGRWTELREMAQMATGSTQTTGDLVGEAWARSSLALAAGALYRHNEAIEHGQAAVKIFRGLSDASGEARAQLALGIVYKRDGQLALAEACMLRGISRSREAQLPRLEANLLDNLGTLYQWANRFDEAISTHRQGLEIRLKENYPLGIAASKENLAWALLRAGDPRQAAQLFEEASDLAGEVGYVQLRAACLWGLADALQQLGKPEAARAARLESVATLKRLDLIDDHETESVLQAERPEKPRALRAVA